MVVGGRFRWVFGGFSVGAHGFYVGFNYVGVMCGFRWF